ncbi:MAG: sodium:proton antiporter [Phycisphaerales bacterium]|nr:MAG: sodium:proton antiporter [Phycisphaerales bacterium]
MSHEQVAPARGFQRWAIALGVIALGLIILEAVTHAPPVPVGGHADEHGGGHGVPPPMVMIAPFAGLLLSIAILPLLPATSHWWEHNKNRFGVAMAFAAMTLLYYAFSGGLTAVRGVLVHAVFDEYIPFIVLLFSLYVISGGISLKGDVPAHPATNTAFLGLGALLASFVGTTGASMLLIRPLLQTNQERKHVTHTVIFFIFLVSNIGECLLPIGDPPLFLGYLRGVPFLWTLVLWPEWLICTVALLAIYYAWDTIAYRQEEKIDIVSDELIREPLTLNGKINFLFLLGVVLCVALIKPGEPLPGGGPVAPPLVREMAMLALVGASLLATPKWVRMDNQFNYHAIIEVAALFIGIFICMQVPIEILRASGETLSQVIKHPWHFFWFTGALSSFLDNAPTYVVFFETADTMTPPGTPGVVTLLDGTVIRETWLIAISLGAVFMGAMTYIGNGPNFMVKSIAEQSGVRMPSFFGYMLYSVGILVPLFIIITVVML